MELAHTTLWLDRQRARVIHFEDQRFPMQRFERDITITSDAAASDATATAFLAQVCEALGESTEVLLTGTPEAMADFERHILVTKAQVWWRIVGVQSVPAPSDARLAALSRWHFTRVQPLPADILDA